MLNLNSIMLNTSDLQKLSKFYEEVFGKKADMVDDTYHGWKVGDTFFSIGFHSEIQGEAKDPDRILFNFETEDVKGEFERISKVDGVKVVKRPYNPMAGEEEAKKYSEEEMKKFLIATFADPDGNLFQLMSPWEDSSS